jgi:hypothetical protein
MAGSALSGDQGTSLIKEVRIETRQFDQSVKIETFHLTAPEPDRGGFAGVDVLLRPSSEIPT